MLKLFVYPSAERDDDVTHCIVAVEMRCYNGNGADYRGTFARASDGSACAKWTQARNINPQTHPNKARYDA